MVNMHGQVGPRTGLREDLTDAFLDLQERLESLPQPPTDLIEEMRSVRETLSMNCSSIAEDQLRALIGEAERFLAE